MIKKTIKSNSIKMDVFICFKKFVPTVKVPSVERSHTFSVQRKKQEIDNISVKSEEIVPEGKCGMEVSLHEYASIQSLLEDLDDQSRWENLENTDNGEQSFLTPYR